MFRGLLDFTKFSEVYTPCCIKTLMKTKWFLIFFSVTFRSHLNLGKYAMKNCSGYLVIVIIMFQSSTYSFQITDHKSTFHRVDITNIQTEVNQAKKSLDILMQSFDSLKIEFNNQKKLNTELQHSLEQSNSVISNLNSLIGSFGTLYTVITLVFGVLGVSLPLVLYFTTRKEAERAIVRFDKSVEDVKRKFDLYKDEINILIVKRLTEITLNLEKRFKDFLVKDVEQNIEQAIINLGHSSEDIRKNGAEYIRNVYSKDLSKPQLYKIKLLLQQNRYSQDVIDKLTSLLYDFLNDDYCIDYFLNVWHYPHLYSVINVRYYSYRYVLKCNLPQKMESMTKLILLTDHPSDEYLRVIDWISSDRKDIVIDLINYKSLNDNQLINKDRIIEKLTHNSFDELREQIIQSYLFKSFSVRKVDGANS